MTTTTPEQEECPMCNYCGDLPASHYLEHDYSCDRDACGYYCEDSDITEHVCYQCYFKHEIDRLNEKVRRLERK